MINSLDKIIILRHFSHLFLLIITCFLTPNVLANPVEDNLNIPSESSTLKLSESEALTIQEKLDLPNEFISETTELTSSELLNNSENLVNKGNTEQKQSDIIDEKVQEKQTKSCSTFTPLTNTVKPNISPDDNQENKIEPTSACAADLIGEPNSQESINKEPETSLIVQETVPEVSPDLSIQTIVDDDRWHFKLQPYATVPINAYGTVSARGQTVSYHLTLGELLDTLRVTASGRFEGWKGRWGFIVDGYFVSLKDIGNLQIARARTPNPINTLNFLLNRSVNSKIQEVVSVLDREVQAVRRIQEFRDNGTLQNAEQRLQSFREDVQRLRELQSRIQDLREIAPEDAQRLRELQSRIQDFRVIVAEGDQRLRELQSTIQDFRGTVAENAQRLRELQSNLQEFRENVVKDGQRLEVIALKVEELQDLRSRVQELRDQGLNIDGLPNLDINTERLKKILALGIQNLPIIDKLEELNNRIRESNKLTDLREIRERFTQARENLEQISQQVRELRETKEQLQQAREILQQGRERLQQERERLQQDGERLQQAREILQQGREILQQDREKLQQAREILQQDREKLQQAREILQQDREQLQNLEAKIEEAKALLDREIQAIQKFQEFQANQEPQQFNAGVGASLQFDQGIYDFALSYHIGDLPSHELPDKPSNRNFPLIWFQPIAGVRLNDISIDIQTITNFQISTSLVNIQGTIQQNFTKDRTWFEPLLGGKFGIQISDPITFWLRGDASGFGLAGETDISWNLLFGVDWWVHKQISLQLGYRFYEIDYGNSNDNGDFAFEENFNGPFLSATFHF